MQFKKTNKLHLMFLKDMLENDKKKLSLIQNEMRIGISLLYGNDSWHFWNLHNFFTETNV